MNKDTRREELGSEELKKVTGGVEISPAPRPGERPQFDMVGAQERMREIMEQNSMSMKEGTEMPHSKKVKGALKK